MLRTSLTTLAATALLAAPALALADSELTTNRRWEALPAPGDGEGRRTLAAAAEAVGGGDYRLADEPLSADRLHRLAETHPDEPLVRRLREDLGQAIDRRDFLYFLDDLARSRPETARVHSGRARRAGILLNPAGVFDGQRRNYGGDTLNLEPPPQPPDLEPAPDGAPLGPRWSARYPNPADEAARMQALTGAGHDGFRERLKALFQQLRAQGAEVHVMATVRRRERGYLMYGAFRLSRTDSAAEVRNAVRELERLNDAWELGIPIAWHHPAGWRRTREAARRMAEAYNVVYATRAGARHSSHYTGGAIDFAALALPRTLELTAPDGAARTFDLADADEPRDLNLTPRLIDWVEAHFQMRKLRSDYPHWEDASGS